MNVYPLPEGHTGHCIHCGRKIEDEEAVLAVPECRSVPQEPLQFCSNKCASEYINLICGLEKVEEEQQDLLERSGPT